MAPFQVANPHQITGQHGGVEAVGPWRDQDRVRQPEGRRRRRLRLPTIRGISPSDFRRAAFFIATGARAVHATGAEAGRQRRSWKCRARLLCRPVCRRQHSHRGRVARQLKRRGGVGLHPSEPARSGPPFKAPPSRCPPTATPPSWADRSTARRREGQRGSMSNRRCKSPPPPILSRQAIQAAPGQDSSAPFRMREKLL
jgi:hypothetical protein